MLRMCGLICLSLTLLPLSFAQPIMRPLMSVAAASCQAKNWDRYKLDDDEMSVALPTLPAMSSYRVNREFANRSQIRHVVGAYADGVAYVIYVYERKESLEDFIANFRRLTEGDFVRDVMVAGVHGKQFGFSNDTRHGSTYFLASKSRIYVFQAQGSLLGNPDIGISKFLESIKFAKNGEGESLVDGPGLQLDPQPVSDSANSDNQPMSGKLVSLKVIIVSKPEPTYTEEARQHQTTGTVVIRCVFRSSGAVTNITPMSRLEHGLTEKAIAAARQIRFIPAVKDGRFVSMYMQLEYNFNLY